MREASEVVIQALAVAYEVTQTEISKIGLRMVAHDLTKYDPRQVLGAIERCRKEIRRGGLTTNEILARLADGRPGPEEAWAMIPKASSDLDTGHYAYDAQGKRRWHQDDAGTVVWTAEMRGAWAAASPLIESGDIIAGRMAFLEAYRAQLLAARETGAPVVWEVSLGWDSAGRERAILDAVEKGRLTHQAAVKLLPNSAFKDSSLQTQELIGKVVALPAPEDRPRRMSDLLKTLPIKTVPEGR